MNPTEPSTATTRSLTDSGGGDGWAERFFELAVDPLAVVGYDGSFKRVNPFWERLFGWPAADLLARPYGDFVHPDDREGVERALQGLTQNEPPGRDLELRFRSRDDSYRWLSVSGQASTEEQLIYVVAKDVTGRRRVEQALRHSEERFRSVIAALDEGILVQGADGVVQACNRAAEQILGLTAEELSGASPADAPWQAVTPDGRPLSPEERPALRALRSGRPVTGEVLGVVREDESVVWLSVNSYPLASPGEHGPRAVVTSFTDITQSKRAEDALREAEERFRTAFDAAPIGVVLMGLDGRYLFANPAMGELLCMPAAEVAGRDFREVTPPEDVPVQEECNRRLLAGERTSYSLETCYLRADGAVTWALLTSALIRDADGEPRGFITQVLDVTERRHAQQDLERSNADLEQFASAASHDLREPLVVVKGYLELLTQRHAVHLNEEGQRFLATGVEAVERMQGLIADLLEWSRAGAEIHRRSVDSGTLAQEALDGVGHHVRMHGTVVAMGDMPTVRAEPTALRRVFQNLLSNAVKFGLREGPRVRVSAEREGAAWRFTIADNGPGIAPDDRERAFAMFERLGARQTGTGIGLAICRRIVERHGGRMWLDEAPEGGAAFHFTIED